MLTGDALPIASEIAAEVGLGGKISRLPTWRSWPATNDAAAAAELAEASDGFAEIYPEGKYTVVKEPAGRAATWSA